MIDFVYELKPRTFASFPSHDRTHDKKKADDLGFIHQSKFIYPKYSKQLLSTVAHTIDCVCSKILNHGLNHGLSFSLFKFFG